MSNMSSNSKLTTRGFYIEYRTSVMFAREDPEDAIPHFHSLEEWEPVKSTKLDTAARLCQYFLQRDGLLVPTFTDGRVHFPPLPPINEETATNDGKIVVFTEFPSMISLFINVSLCFLHPNVCSYVVSRSFNSTEWRYLLSTAACPLTSAPKSSRNFERNQNTACLRCRLSGRLV